MNQTYQPAYTAPIAPAGRIPTPNTFDDPAYQAWRRARYIVKGYDDSDTFTELEDFATLADATAYARETVAAYGWIAAIVKHNGRTVYDTDRDPEFGY